MVKARLVKGGGMCRTGSKLGDGTSGIWTKRSRDALNRRDMEKISPVRSKRGEKLNYLLNSQHGCKI